MFCCVVVGLVVCMSEQPSLGVVYGVLSVLFLFGVVLVLGWSVVEVLNYHDTDVEYGVERVGGEDVVGE